MRGEVFLSYLEERKRIANTPTQITGAIRPIRLMNTDAMPAVTPDVAIIHVASIHSGFIRINPICAKIVLGGFRIAFLHKCIVLTDVVYKVMDIRFNQDNPGEIMARLERMPEDA